MLAIGSCERSGRASSKGWSDASEGVKAALPPPAPEIRGWRLKAYEDKLDAVVCAAVAIACLKGEPRPFGDEDAAIWVPTARA